MQIRNMLSQIPLTLLISLFVVISHAAGEFSGLMTIDFRSLTLDDSGGHAVLSWSGEHGTRQPEKKAEDARNSLLRRPLILAILHSMAADPPE